MRQLKPHDAGFLYSDTTHSNANVTLISGPTSLADPVGMNVQRVETAEQMAQAVRAAIRDADALIMAAAVADFQSAVADQIDQPRNPP